MATNEDLQAFVHGALAQGIDRVRIAAILDEAGWPADEVRTALNRYASVEFPIPVPRPVPYVSAREAFLYLVLFGTLYVSAFNLGGLIFQLINRAIPDPTGAPFSLTSVRWSLSSLIVAFPVFLVVARAAARRIARDPTERASKVRRWLAYLTMFVASSILLGDVVGLVYNLLSGELTLRFVLKALTVGGIAGGVFAYYRRDLQRDEAGDQR